ncbi:hypothetical protein MMC16_004069 [Acarospora aff. strigata]|nr:hypothetical protein [Acarospora aff. strigata]
MTSPTPPPIISPTTILSLLSTLLLLLAAYAISLRHLPHPNTPTKYRILYIWHLFDALTHFLLEGSYLYNCFFTYTLLPLPSSPRAVTSDYPHPASLGGARGKESQGGGDGRGFFLGYRDRLYGSNYGTNAFARLWQEYAKADKRWGGADATVISLELLTVLLAGPVAAYICVLIGRVWNGRAGGAGVRGVLVRRDGGGGSRGMVKGKDSSGEERKRRTETAEAKLWFLATVLATAELYGGFMTFAPEWLSGSPNLNTSNWMYLWVYLFFFNTLWVWFPLWVLYEAYMNIRVAFAAASGTGCADREMAVSKRKKVS